MRPLDGVRVLDLSQMFGAPGAAMYLADQGADVVKVEPPTGDRARYTYAAPPIRDGQSRTYLFVGRNKRGVALDLSKPAGQDVVHRLIPQFDVVIVNLRPEVAVRLRLDYETLRALNTRLIYVHLTAYGWHGPFADRPGYDLIIQALSGVYSRRRLEDGTPVSAPVWVADASVPMVLAYGVALALLMRDRTGEGQKVESSLLNAALAMSSLDAIRVPQENASDKHDYARQAMYAPYRCQDGAWLAIVVIQDREWQRLCRALAIEHVAGDDRFSNAAKRARESEVLHPLFAGIFETRPREEWLAILREHDIPSAPILTHDEVFDYEQLVSNGMWIDVDDQWAGPTRMPAAPLRLMAAEAPTYRPAPQLGQHSDEVLREAGFSDDDIKGLRASAILF